MKHNGTVYGLIGVIGSGKSYRLNKFLEEGVGSVKTIITGDFSDGVRDSVLNIFGTTECRINTSSKVYSDWKDMEQKISYPVGESLVTSTINGRELLQHVGEYIKKLAGNDVWSRWTSQDVLKKFSFLEEDEKSNCDIVFGSVRFLHEAEAVISVARTLNMKVKFIFCDYHSLAYEINDHVSEMFAQHFLKEGYKDGDDVTEHVKLMMYGSCI